MVTNSKLYNHKTPNKGRQVIDSPASTFESLTFDIISPHNINTILSRQVMRIKNNINRELIVDPVSNTLN